MVIMTAGGADIAIGLQIAEVRGGAAPLVRRVE